jgi:hypothetical protein
MMPLMLMSFAARWRRARECAADARATVPANAV